MFLRKQASDWVIKIKDQTCLVEEGKASNADITIKADAEDGVKLLTGKMDPLRAFMFGKVKVSGDMALGMKLINLFKKYYDHKNRCWFIQPTSILHSIL